MAVRQERTSVQSSLKRTESQLESIYEDCRKRLEELAIICGNEKFVLGQVPGELLAALTKPDLVNEEGTDDVAIISPTELREIESLLERAKLTCHHWDNEPLKPSLPPDCLKRHDRVRLPPLNKNVSSAANECIVTSNQKQCKQSLNRKKEERRPQVIMKKSRPSEIKNVAGSSRLKRTLTKSVIPLSSRRTEDARNMDVASVSLSGAIPKKCVHVLPQREYSSRASVVRRNFEPDQQADSRNGAQNYKFHQRQEKLISALHFHQIIVDDIKKLPVSPSSKYKKIFLQKLDSTESTVKCTSSAVLDTSQKYKQLFQKLRMAQANGTCNCEWSETVKLLKRTFEKLEDAYKSVAGDTDIFKSSSSNVRRYKDAVTAPWWLWHHDASYHFSNLCSTAAYKNMTELLLFGTLLHEIQWLHLQLQLQSTLSGEVLFALQSMELHDRRILPRFKCLYSLLCEDGYKFPTILSDVVI